MLKNEEKKKLIKPSKRKKRFVIEETRSGKILTKEMKLEEAQTWLDRLQELARHNNSGRLYRITDMEKLDA